MKILAALKGGVQTAPLLGAIVGTQMAIQKIIEEHLIKKKENHTPSFLSMMASSMLVGFISTPFYAVFNGKTLGKSSLESIKSLTFKATAAIVTRETSFLFSLRISDPVCEMMKKMVGDNKAVEYSSTFVSGAIGSLVGHPADAALTCWQKERKIENLSLLVKGIKTRAVTIACFSVLYKASKDTIQYLTSN